jgi:hypothetical protein
MCVYITTFDVPTLLFRFASFVKIFIYKLKTLARHLSNRLVQYVVFETVSTYNVPL